MLHTLKILVSILLTWVFSAMLSAQNPQQRAVLNRFSEESAREFALKKAEAMRMASEQGLSMRLDLGNGRVAELMYFDRGRPVYLFTGNADGAGVINSDKVYPGGQAGLSLSGAGQVLGIWDAGKVRNTHEELTGRVTQKDGASINSNHATHVAGTMIASGFQAAAKGMSFQASLHAYDWNDDNTEMAVAASQGLMVSQHSYGYITGWAYGNYSGTEAWHWFGDVNLSQTEDYAFGFYNGNAQDWDFIAHNAPNYLIVKSAGNDRGYGPASGTSHYAWINDKWTLNTTVRDKNGGANGYDCISHNGVSKNILSIGAVTNTGAMTSFSSWGPTDDGRIKPDVVAKGSSVYSSTAESNSAYASYGGTSMSGPMVSGSVGLLLQHQENLHPGQPLRAATMKALILHSANDNISGAPGPDYAYGWGMMDTQKAASIMSENVLNGEIHIQELLLTNGGQITIPVRAKGNEPLRATIVWTDVPGTPVAAALNPTNPMLVNDLDMRLANASNHTFYPYILDPANPALAATTGDNFRDNVEMIHIASPGANELYQMTITHKGSLSGESQAFSLVISGNQPVTGVINPTGFIANTISASQIDLSWSKNESEEHVMLVWSPNGMFGTPVNGTSYSAGQTISGGGTVLYRGDNTIYNHTGLLQGTTHHYKAFSYSTSDNYSSGITSQSTTLCEDISLLPFTENFNTSQTIPNCWNIIDYSGNGQVWQFGTHQYGLTGTTGNYAFLDSDSYGYDNSQNTDLITPLIDLSGFTQVNLSFTHYFRQFESTSSATLSYSLDNGTNWTQIQQWTSTTANPATFSQTISQLSGQPQVRIKWNYTGSWSYFWDVDDVVITGVPLVTYTLTYTADTGGSISGVSPQTVNHGENGSEVSAVALAGYDFVAWSDGLTTAARTDMNVTSDLVVTATFDINTSNPETLVLENQVIDPYEELCFSNTHTITTAGNGTVFIALPGSTASLIAGERIIMLPGTHLQAGSQVHAYIAPNGPFCEEPDKQMVAAEAEAEAERSEVPSDSEGSLDKAEAEVEVEVEAERSEVPSDSEGSLGKTEKLISVYPNPTSGRFTLEIHTADQTDKTLVEVYGLRGERVLREELPGDLHQHILSIEGQLPGLYMVRVVSGQDVGVARIIKR